MKVAGLGTTPSVGFVLENVVLSKDNPKCQLHLFFWLFKLTVTDLQQFVVRFSQYKYWSMNLDPSCETREWASVLISSKLSWTFSPWHFNNLPTCTKDIRWSTKSPANKRFFKFLDYTSYTSMLLLEYCQDPIHLS